MFPVDKNSLVDIDFRLDWKSPGLRHVDLYHAAAVNVWRDWLSPRMIHSLMGSFPGDTFELELYPGDGIPRILSSDRITIERRNFGYDVPTKGVIHPRAGRFYPKGLLRHVSGVFPQNVTPFRCLEVEDASFRVDLGHPFSGNTALLTATVGDIQAKTVDKGGSSVDWVGLLTDGPGMQVRWNGSATDFFSDNPFEREDERPDEQFYEHPRRVQHIDDTAIAQLQRLHGRHLADGMRILDLMGSWATHLPLGLKPSRLAVLGMNEAELSENPRATDHVAHDLNQSPILPYPSRSFDAVICSVSIEYLIHPVSVLREVGRVLKPGGVCMVSFSDRWFPPKAIRIWKDLHDFERMGLVLEYFFASSAFTDLTTYSVRGWPRPVHDKYYGQRFLSDPIFMVFGKTHLAPGDSQ